MLPLLHARVNAAEGEEFFFVVNHFRAARAGERIIFLQEDRFFRADFLAEAAEDAPKHVDLEFLRHLLRVRTIRELPRRTGRRDLDGLGRTDKFAKLAAHAFGAAFLILHKIRRAAIALRHDPFLLGILHRHFLFEEVAQRDFEPADDGRQIKPLPKIQWFAFDDHLKFLNPGNR